MGRVGGLIFGLALIFPPTFVGLWYLLSAGQEGQELNANLNQVIVELKDAEVSGGSGSVRRNVWNARNCTGHTSSLGANIPRKSRNTSVHLSCGSAQLRG